MIILEENRQLETFKHFEGLIKDSSYPQGGYPNTYKMNAFVLIYWGGCHIALSHGVKRLQHLLAEDVALSARSQSLSQEAMALSIT